MLPSDVHPLLLHEIFPSEGSLVMILAMLAAMAFVAYLLWGYVETRFGEKALLLAVLAGSALLSFSLAILLRDITVVRATILGGLGALGGSAWASHTARTRLREGNAAGCLASGAGFVGGMVSSAWR